MIADSERGEFASDGDVAAFWKRHAVRVRYRARALGDLDDIYRYLAFRAALIA